MNSNNVLPELQILLNQRLCASEGQPNGDPKKRPGSMLRGAVKVPIGSPSNASPQGGSTWPARRQHPTRDPISFAPVQHRPTLPKQRGRTVTFDDSAMNAPLNGNGWTTNDTSNWDSHAKKNVVKDLSDKLRQTQQGSKEAYTQNRQILEERRHYGENNNNWRGTQKNPMDNLVQQNCAEFAALNKSLMDSQERLQEECGQYEMHNRRLASELSACQAQNRNLMESHMEECRDFMAHERDLMESQSRLMEDCISKEAENDILKHAQQSLSDEYQEQLNQNSFLVGLVSTMVQWQGSDGNPNPHYGEMLRRYSQGHPGPPTPPDPGPLHKCCPLEGHR